RIYRGYAARSLALIAGAQTFVEAARAAGLRLAVCTASTPENMALAFERHPIDRWVETVTSPADHASGPLPGLRPGEGLRGKHRLVRQSPFDQAHRRHTAFATVIVAPLLPDDAELEIDEGDLKIDTYRAQGAGGQHVNKTDSAVRLTHLPTNVVAQSQNERSQTQNKEMAIRVLKARLLERALEEKEAEVRKLKGEHVEAGWGNQIRSYVLHPYQMVKDLRTQHETGNTTAVLDGDLDDFMQAELERLATGGDE
ncbi:MAG: peptide chain release factor-like protein, partial [Chloroflexota bacterium]